MRTVKFDVSNITDGPVYYCSQCCEVKSHNDPRHIRLCPTCHMFTLVPMSVLKELSLTSAKQIERAIADDKRKYYLISLESFETVVPHIDAHDANEAVAKSLHPLQPWYLNKQGSILAEALLESRVLSYTQYIDWLRKGDS